MSAMRNLAACLLAILGGAAAHAQITATGTIVDDDGAGFCAESTVISYNGTHYVDPSCVGYVPTGVTLTAYGGPTTITTPGTTIDSKDISGCLDVQADNVNITRNRIRCGSTAAINQASGGGADSLLIEDNEIECTDTSGAVVRAIDSERGFTARRNYIHGCVDQIWAESGSVSAILIEYNYFGPPEPYLSGPDPHIDSIQIPENANNITVQHNTLFNPDGDGSSVITTGSNMTNILIEDNVVAGALSCLRVAESDTANTNVRVRNMLFSHRYFATCGSVEAYDIGSGVTEHTGSKDFETGAPL